jgi:peroxiredoxin
MLIVVALDFAENCLVGKECPMRSHHPLSGWFLGVRCACRLTLLGHVIGGCAVGDELPRYKLKVGQEVIYRTVDPPKESDGGKGGKNSSQYIVEWTVNVVRQNEDSTWRCLFTQKGTSIRTRGEKTSTNESVADGYFDLSADGRFFENRSIQPMANPTALFPPLPPDGHDPKTAWEADLTLDATHRKLQVDESFPAQQDEWRFVEEPKMALDSIYEHSTTRSYIFDRQQGLVRKATMIYQRGWPANRASKSEIQTIALISTRELDNQDATDLNADVDRYVAAGAAYWDLFLRANRDFAHVAEWLDKAESSLKEIEPQLKTSLVRAMLSNKLKQPQNSREYYITTGEKFGPQIDKPSQDWSTTDLAGTPHALADYRGKVVVLDFWYRGCVWCIRAMPQMQQLVDEFSEQDVAILGVNSDQDDNDALFVIDKLKLNYPTLRNGSATSKDRINTKYLIHGWPTLVVIDSKGVVRHFHSGYSPTLRHDLGEKIRELLAENQP